MAGIDYGPTQTGIKANVAALLSYVLGFITGIIFLLIEKENKFVRFHAWQATLTFGIFAIIGIVLARLPFLGGIGLMVLWSAETIAWVVLMVKAYQGEKFKLPVIGDFAEQKSGL